MTKKTVSPTPARTEAPAAVAAPALDPLGRVQFELLPILRGLELLADSLRVLRAIQDAVTLEAMGPARPLRKELDRACPDWGNPLAHAGNSLETLHQMAGVAHDLAQQIVAAE